MDPLTTQRMHREARKLSERQLDLVTWWQLRDLEFKPDAIKHRISRGQLHPLRWEGVYAVGSRRMTRHRLWMAAVLACGDGATLSHRSAGALYGIVRPGRDIHVSVPAGSDPRPPGIVVHKRQALEATRRHGIPVTTPACTIVDMAPGATPDELERLINEADARGVITVPALRAAVDDMPRRPGVRKVKKTIDRRTFRYTRSGLERAFIPIAIKAGFERPLTRQWVNGFEVDFHWPNLKVVIETDGGTFHRTPAQQAADRRRDLTHTAAGLTALRFTHGQIRYEPAFVLEILTAVYRSSMVNASSPTSRNFV
jgi:very-short-patch-repair endonuclease